MKMTEQALERLRNRQRAGKERQMERKRNRDISKMQSTLKWALKCVRDEAEWGSWSSSHINCFRCSISAEGIKQAESEAHIRAKFERYLHWRKHGASVLTEVIWKNKSRSDLVICTEDGEIMIEEIVVSEKEQSLKEKEDKYPFPFKIVVVE